VERVYIDPPWREGDRGPLNQHGFARHLCLDDGEALREGVIGEPRRGAGPKKVSEVIAGEALAGFERQADEECEMLPRAEAHRLARC
jgi:hypothetical protein